MKLKDKCLEMDLNITEVSEISNTSRDTLRNWLKDKPELLDVVLNGVYFKKLLKTMKG